MKKALILMTFVIFAMAVSTVSAQQSKAVFKGTAENSTGLKFSDWDLTLVKNNPLVLKQTVKPMQANSLNFKAKKGEKISIKVVSKISTPFVVYENWEDGGQIGESPEGKQFWQGTIARDGEYKIVLSADGTSNYTITIKSY